jgi:GT2 family glycosyltransferase
VITAVSVVYNTKGLIQRAIESIRKFYPKMDFLIIDGSDMWDDCYWYLESIKSDETRVIHAHRNIGHGSGMHLAMELLNSEYVLFFDSDVEMYQPCIDEMKALFNDGIYGVGTVSDYVIDDMIGEAKIEKTGEMIKLLNPYFCIIKQDEYFKYAPIISNEAPLVLVWHDLHRKGIECVDFPVNRYVMHEGAQTRNMIPNEWHTSEGVINWQIAWNKYVEKNGL